MVDKGKQEEHLTLRVVLGCLCLLQLALGVAGLVGGQVAEKTIILIYGGFLSMTPQLAYIIRIISAYFLTVAFLTYLALLDPVKNKVILKGIILLMGLRFLGVLIGAGQAHKAFHIPLGRVWFDGVVFLIIGIMIIVFWPREKTVKSITSASSDEKPSEN